MRLIALAPAEQRRLERLAKLAGRTPQSMLRFVLRDGFDACEEDVRESRAADAEFNSRRSLSHGDAIASARAAIASHGRRHKQAA